MLVKAKKSVLYLLREWTGGNAEAFTKLSNGDLGMGIFSLVMWNQIPALILYYIFN